MYQERTSDGWKWIMREDLKRRLRIISATAESVLWSIRCGGVWTFRGIDYRYDAGGA